METVGFRHQQGCFDPVETHYGGRGWRCWRYLRHSCSPWSSWFQSGLHERTRSRSLASAETSAPAAVHRSVPSTSASPNMSATSEGRAPDRLLGVLRHQGLKFALRALVVEKGPPGVAEERSEVGPRVRRAHIDNADRLVHQARRPHSGGRPRKLDLRPHGRCKKGTAKAFVAMCVLIALSRPHRLN